MITEDEWRELDELWDAGLIPTYFIHPQDSVAFRSTHNQPVVQFTNNKEDDKQGEWIVDGVPSGGFNVHSLRKLLHADVD